MPLVEVRASDSGLRQQNPKLVVFLLKPERVCEKGQYRVLQGGVYLM
jgi:hypothetical protein